MNVEGESMRESSKSRVGESGETSERKLVRENTNEK